MKKLIKGGDAVSTYSARRSATERLRKLGVAATDYDMFIMQTTDGRYAVNAEKAKEHLAAKLRKVATQEVPQKKNKGRTLKEAESNQVKRPTVAATIRGYIMEGLDNKTIHEIMVRDFGHTEDKAHYPGWYRSQMKREGLVPPASRKPKKTKAAKVAKVKKVKQPKAVKTKVKRTKIVKKKAAASHATAAQKNIADTAKAGINTGNKSESVAPLTVVQVS